MEQLAVTITVTALHSFKVQIELRAKITVDRARIAFKDMTKPKNSCSWEALTMTKMAECLRTLGERTGGNKVRHNDLGRASTV